MISNGKDCGTLLLCTVCFEPHLLPAAHILCFSLWANLASESFLLTSSPLPSHPRLPCIHSKTVMYMITPVVLIAAVWFWYCARVAHAGQRGGAGLKRPGDAGRGGAEVPEGEEQQCAAARRRASGAASPAAGGRREPLTELMLISRKS